MFRFFYRFHNKALGNDLFNRDTEDGTPSPPDSEQRITEDGEFRDTQSGILRITE
jgi:hypothetical protein